MPADDEAQRYAEAVEMFETMLEEFVAWEMPDAEIDRAFHEALAAWRRADPDHIRERAEEQRRQAAIRVEAFLRSAPPGVDETAPVPLPPIMADPASVFRRPPLDGERTFKTSEALSRRAASEPDAPRIAQDGPGQASKPDGRVD